MPKSVSNAYLLMKASPGVFWASLREEGRHASSLEASIVSAVEGRVPLCLVSRTEGEYRVVF